MCTLFIVYFSVHKNRLPKKYTDEQSSEIEELPPVKAKPKQTMRKTYTDPSSESDSDINVGSKVIAPKHSQPSLTKSPSEPSSLSSTSQDGEFEF